MEVRRRRLAQNPSPHPEAQLENPSRTAHTVTVKVDKAADDRQIEMSSNTMGRRSLLKQTHAEFKRRFGLNPGIDLQN
jgi:hypothetical protein